MKKLLSLTLMAFGVLCLTHRAEASVVARAPKEVFVSSFTTGMVTITPAISTNAPSTAAFMPGAIYQVVLGTGASSEFYQLYDSTFVPTTCGASLGSTNPLLGPKLLFGSTTANTTITFDPPLLFHNGLQGCDSAVTGQAAIVFELGRGLSGQ